MCNVCKIQGVNFNGCELNPSVDWVYYVFIYEPKINLKFDINLKCSNFLAILPRHYKISQKLAL